MKILDIKVVQTISFLLIIFPSKILLPNGLILIGSLLEAIFSLFGKDFDEEVILYSFLTFLAILSLVLMFRKNKLINGISVVLQYIWLFYMFKLIFLKNLYYLLTISIYIFITGFLIYQLFSKQNNKSFI